MSGRLKNLEQALKDYVLENGPIESAGRIMERREGESWKLTDPYGLQQALRTLAIHPMDILPVTGLSKSKLYKVLEKHGVIRHYADLTKNHGAIKKELNEPRLYVAPRKAS